MKGRRVEAERLKGFKFLLTKPSINIILSKR
jgi:hypothetical protein